MLVLLYYFSQNPDFAESVKPLMSKLKDSQQMLDFLNDLSKFSQTFSTFQAPNKGDCKEEKTPPEKEKSEKTPQSPTSGIADEFIQQILENYLTKNK